MSKKQLIQYLIVFVVGGFFLYFVFNGIAWDTLSHKLTNANYTWIALGMCIGLISHMLRAWRANMLYTPIGYNVTIAESFAAVMIGYMMNYLIPRAGEVSRCAVLNKTNQIPIEKSLGTVVIERIVDLIMLVLVLIVVIALNLQLIGGYFSNFVSGSNIASSPTRITFLLLVAAALLTGYVLIRKFGKRFSMYTKIIDMIRGFSEGLLSIRKLKHPILFSFLSIAIWMCYALMMYYCLFAMQATAHLTFMNGMVVFAIGTIGMIVPAPAAGAGTYHFAVMQALMLYGVAEDDGIAYATIVHGVQMIVLVAMGACCSLWLLIRSKSNQV